MKYLFSFVFCFILTVAFAQPTRRNVDGYVKNRQGEPLGFASILIKELNVNYITDKDGYFKYAMPSDEAHTLIVSALNYVEKEISVSGEQKELTIILQEQSYALDEVVVMANYKKNLGTVAEISQQALEHIQPTSISDVLILTPGGLFKDSKITGFDRISLRQSGSDANTALGMAVIMDGMPLDNDGFRTQMPGFESDYDFGNRTGLNQGMDMRTISTDHLQKIEIVKGISSAKIGNLSSGVIQTTSKIGETPLQIRVKADPLNKLFYAGKGLRISPALGFIHAGVDVVSSYDDRRDPLSKYNRITGQLTYNNSYDIHGRPLFLFVKLSETHTLNTSKEDELIREYNESYKNTYSRSGLTLRVRMADLGRVVDHLELVSLIDYTYDLVDRNRMVQLGAPMPSPLAMEEGESEGIFLPSKYYSAFRIENKPLVFRNQINAESLFRTGGVQHKLIYGAEWKSTKNHGRGVIVDMSRPPYPGDSKYVRPRPNRDIPALSAGAAYIEDQLHYANRYFDFSLNAGVRGTRMLNLNARYEALNKLMLEPRINTALSHNIKLNNGKILKSMFRFGFGQENKLPTLDFLYPDKIYKDLIVLSAYVKHEDPNNHLITNTRIYDVTNDELRPGKNTKVEIGWDLEYEGTQLSLTAFREYADNGFHSSTQYYPVSYLRYFEPKDGEPITGRQPQKSDYEEELYETFLDMPMVRNDAKLKKKGIEYRLKFPRLRAIATTIEINGAYYDSRYSTSAPVQYHPAFKDENKPMPYVGIYAQDDVDRRRILNTNVWFNTNVPKYKMIFTTFVQVIWLNDVRRINGSSYPSAYMDLNGEIHPVTEDILQKIKEEDLVWRHYHLYKEPYYEKEPVSFTLNFKAAKEFGKHIRAAFFVNNIIDINPGYKNRYQQNARNWKKAFFGAEITFSL